MNNQPKYYLELCRLKISLFSALSAATGFILAMSRVSLAIIIPSLGVFLLACGASALNQYQERKTDALMRRTEKRPLPSGNIDPLRALGFSLLLLLAGFLLLSLAESPAALLLGLFAVLWYNGLYTYLKRKTAFAAVPGAIVGAIPPAIGWVYGGGDFPGHEIFVVCYFFFIWQIPHFWLLLLSNKDDYERAGLPSLQGIFSSRQLIRLIFTWVFAAGVTCLLIPLYNLSESLMSNVFFVAITGWLIWNGLKLFRQQEDKLIFSLMFRKMNTYMLLIMILLSIDHIFY